MLHYVHSSLIYNSQELERTQLFLNRGMDTKNGTFTQWSTTQLLKTMNLWNLRQIDGSGGYHPECGNPVTKEFIKYALTDKWILAQKTRIPKIQFAKHKKIKKEDQHVDTSFLPRIGNIKPVERVTETKFCAKTKGWTIQWLPHSGIHSIISQ